MHEKAESLICLVDHRGAGYWLFSNRRWLDPRSPQDLQSLQHNYDNLCACFPVFASVTRPRFLECITAICEEWSKCLHDAQFSSGSASPDADSHGDREESSDERETSDDERDAVGRRIGDRQPPSKRVRPGEAHVGAGSEHQGGECSAGGVGGAGSGGCGSGPYSDSDASGEEGSPGPRASAQYSTGDPHHSDPRPPDHGGLVVAAGVGGGSGGGDSGLGDAPDSESVSGNAIVEL